MGRSKVHSPDRGGRRTANTSPKLDVAHARVERGAVTHDVFHQRWLDSDFRMRRGRRGFTLVEMLVVVILITIFAAMAMPAIAKQMRNQRALQAAHSIAALYRTARMQAMGRGVATLVRFTRGSGNQGRFDVLEAQTAVADPATGCLRAPMPSCLLPNWTDASAGEFRVVKDLDFNASGDGDLVTQFVSPNAASVEVCFTPMGRAFQRTVGPTLLPFTAPFQAEVFRKTGTSRLGLTRSVLILPNGATRVFIDKTP